MMGETSKNVFDFHPAYKYRGARVPGDPACGFCGWPKSLTAEQRLISGDAGYICYACVKTIKGLVEDLFVGVEDE